MFRRKRQFLKSCIKPSNWVTLIACGKTYRVTRRDAFLVIPLGAVYQRLKLWCYDTFNKSLFY